MAQQAPAKPEDAAVQELVVTGIRASLQSAQAIKQNAEVFVDSVSAQDIGALPDRSITEALQRVPGVSMDRFAAGRDPDHFSVEGSGVVVRGLTFVRSEFNGRDAFTANNGRALSFADVPAELVGGVDVFKNQSADMIEGGVAGTINLKTRVPFDAKGQVIAFSLDNTYADLARENSPSGSVLYSNRWDTPIGEIGILADYVQGEIKFRSDAQQISNFGPRYLNSAGVLLSGVADPNAPVPAGNRLVYLPRGAAFRSASHDHTRQGEAFAAQWRSNDQTMLATFQFMRSRSKEAWTEHAMEIATDNVASSGDSRAVEGTTLAFGGDGVFTNGIITGQTGWQDDSFSDMRVPNFGLQSNNIRRDVDSRNRSTDYGFNFKWTPNDRLAFNLDLQHTLSKVRNFDNTLWTSTYQNASIQMHGDDMPTVLFLPPSQAGTPGVCTNGPPSCGVYATGAHTSLSDPFNVFPRSAMDHYEDSEGTEDAVRADLEYRFDDDSFVKSVRGGVRWADRDQTTRFSTYNWGVISEQWGNGGPVWLTDPVDGVQGGTGGTPQAGRFELFTFPDFARGEVPIPSGSDPRLFYAGNTVEGYKDMVALATLMANEWSGTSGHWVPLAARAGVVPGTPFLPGEINPVEETSKDAYLMMRFGHKLDNGIDISGNVGVRYTQLERVTTGSFAFPQPASAFASEATCAVVVPPGQAPQPFCLLPLATRNAARAFLSNANVPNNKSGTDTNYLPSLNLKVDIGGGKLFRFGLSKSLSLPPVGFTRNYYTVALTTLTDNTAAGTTIFATAQAGNPALKPMTAWNLDASFEWYFSKVGQFSFSVFEKRLKDVIVEGTSDVPGGLTNNGATFPLQLRAPENSPDTGKVKGFEVSYQQVYDFLPGLLSGLGLSANYTYVDANGVRQSTLSETDPNVSAGLSTQVPLDRLPLQGLSKHTFNIAPFYEKGPWSLRVAYNWRSRFLLTVRDVIVPFAPIIQEDYGTLDASVFYTINDHLKLGLQGVNLSNSTLRTSSVLNADLLTAPRGWYIDDRRYSVSLRGTF
ncbi:MAG: TonB-dependent receptor [Phenylobacterium sp.]